METSVEKAKQHSRLENNLCAMQVFPSWAPGPFHFGCALWPVGCETLACRAMFCHLAQACSPRSWWQGKLLVSAHPQWLCFLCKWEIMRSLGRHFPTAVAPTNSLVTSWPWWGKMGSLSAQVSPQYSCMVQCFRQFGHRINQHLSRKYVLVMSLSAQQTTSMSIPPPWLACVALDPQYCTVCGLGCHQASQNPPLCMCMCVCKSLRVRELELGKGRFTRRMQEGFSVQAWSFLSLAWMGWLLWREHYLCLPAATSWQYWFS